MKKLIYILALILIPTLVNAQQAHKVQSANGTIINPAKEDGNLAAILSNQTDGDQKTQVTSLPDVTVASMPTVTVQGSVSVSSAPTTTVQGTVTVTATSLPLPTGAATETGNLADIEANQTNGTQIVKGDVTPADAAANPTNTVPVNAYLSALSPSTSQWFRLNTRGFGSDNLTGTGDLGLVVDARLRLFDGTNLDRATGTAENGLDVDVTRISGSNPCVNPTATLTSINGVTSGTNAVQIIALSGTTKIYICSMSIIGVSGTAPTFSLVQGTGANCVTGQTVLVPAWSTAAGTLYPFANPVAVSAAGNAVCYLDTGTTPVQNYVMTYVQQ